MRVTYGGIVGTQVGSVVLVVLGRLVLPWVCAWHGFGVESGLVLW